MAGEGNVTVDTGNAGSIGMAKRFRRWLTSPEQRDWRWSWLFLTLAAAVVLIVVIFDDVRGVYESQRDVAISLSAVAIGFFFGKAREKTERQISSEKLIRLLQADPLRQEKRRDYDEDLERSFVDAMERELRRPIWEQNPEVRRAVEENIAAFLRSLDFGNDMKELLAPPGASLPAGGTAPDHNSSGAGHGEPSGVAVETSLRTMPKDSNGAVAVSPEVAALDTRVKFTSILNLKLEAPEGKGREPRLVSEPSTTLGESNPVVLALDDSIRQYRDDHRILGHLTRLDRDIHACRLRLAEYWDHRAGTPTFPSEAPVLEIIMSDVQSAANATIRLNGIFRNTDSLLGVEPVESALEGLEPDMEVERVKAMDGVQNFQSALRSTTEAKNRYFELLRLLDKSTSTYSLSVSVLRIAGSDTAKALRLFRSISYPLARSSDRAKTLKTLAYLQAAQQRMLEWEPPSNGDADVDVTLIADVYRSDLAAGVTSLIDFLAGTPVDPTNTNRDPLELSQRSDLIQDGA